MPQKEKRTMQYQMKLLVNIILISYCYGCPGNFTTITFYEGFKNRFNDNIFIQYNGSYVHLSLDYSTGGSGFISQDHYKNGLFSAYIKLPLQNYTAGVVLAFYLSNNNTNPTDNQDQHDEIDFEFLGHPYGHEWILQTNFYGNGSITRGREEKYKLWFNPSEEAHKYSIYWDVNKVIFYVDDVPIRVVRNVDGLGGDYPYNPMSLYATIWDGSGWATDGGQYKINHDFDPFVAGFSNLVIHGCSLNPFRKFWSGYVKHCGEMTPKKFGEYEEFRKKYLVYSYCNDAVRYNIPFPECLAASAPTNGMHI